VFYKYSELVARVLLTLRIWILLQYPIVKIL